MSADSLGRTVAFLVASQGAEQGEPTEPWEAVAAAGAQPVLLSTAPSVVQAFNHLDRGERFAVDRVVWATSADEFDALVLPGGVANPHQLRTDKRAVAFIKSSSQRESP